MVATKRRFDPNLQRIRIIREGVAVKAYVCTRCIKGGTIQRAL
jgi:large subunit ribosomal protein L28